MAKSKAKEAVDATAAEGTGTPEAVDVTVVEAVHAAAAADVATLKAALADAEAALTTAADELAAATASPPITGPRIKLEHSGSIVAVQAGEERERRLLIAGHNYEHVSDVEDQGETVWVYRQM